jgi:hypothetical protein
LSLPARAGEPANEASPNLTVPWGDMLLHVQDARKRVPPLQDRNTDFQSVRPAKLRLAAVNISMLHLQHPNVNWISHSVERAANSSAPCASHAAAGYKPAGRTGQRLVFRI